VKNFILRAAEKMPDLRFEAVICRDENETRSNHPAVMLCRNVSGSGYQRPKIEKLTSRVSVITAGFNGAITVFQSDAGPVIVDTADAASAPAVQAAIRQIIGSGARDLRPCTLPHHRTYRFQYPAVGVHAPSARAKSEGTRKP
jgi:hypothetical protein